MNKLIREIAKREGKKGQAHIGDIREILKHLRDILVESMLGYHDLRSDLIMYTDKQYVKIRDRLSKAQSKLQAKKAPKRL